MSYPNIRVLIVDTDASVQNIKVLLMKELGFVGGNIYSADSIKEAFKILDSTSIDFILSELEVSDASGLDFLRKLRENNKHGNLPFIIISAENNNEGIRQEIAEKSSHYIAKPFSAKEFNSTLQQILKAERRVHDRCEVVKDNLVTVIQGKQPVTIGKIVNIGKGGLLAQLEVSRKLIIYDQLTIHISFYGSPSKELILTFNAELLRIERVSRDKTKNTAYYAFVFIKLDKTAKKLLMQLLA